MTPLDFLDPVVESPTPPSPAPAFKAPLRKPVVLRRVYVTGAALLAIAAGVLVARFVAHTGAAAQTDSKLRPIVAVAKVSREDLVQSLTISAEFRPYQQVALHAKIAGYLQSIAVDVGDHVREGQAIAKLDVPELNDDLERAAATHRASEQEVARAEASYNEAHLACTRLQDVAKQQPKLVAEQDLDVVQAKDATAAGTLAVAKQRVAEAAAGLSKVHSMIAYTTITAPFDGVITKRFIDPGALVQAGTSSSSQLPIVNIEEDKKLRLVFPVPESSVTQIAVGAPARVTITSLGTTIDAKVSRFSGKVDRATRTMSTEVDIDNADGRVKPGMYASVELVVREKKDAIAVPVQAIAVGNKPTVFAVGGDGTVEERAVTLDMQTPFMAEVAAGIKPGEMVIVGSRSGVQAGQKVTPKLVEAAAGQ